MKKLTVVCTLVALASPALQAQQVTERSPNAQSAYNIQQNLSRMDGQRYNASANGDRQAYVNSLANLTKLRAKLAEAWQALGMSPQAAQAVAASYQPNFALNSHRASLRGKSDQEIAAMLQSALAKKDYMVANQTLIDYERNKLNLGTDLSPDGKH